MFYFPVHFGSESENNVISNMHALYMLQYMYIYHVKLLFYANLILLIWKINVLRNVNNPTDELENCSSRQVHHLSEKPK